MDNKNNKRSDDYNMRAARNTDSSMENDKNDNAMQSPKGTAENRDSSSMDNDMESDEKDNNS